MSKYLTAIRARIEAATEGPWKAEFSGGMGNCVIPHDARSTREAVCVTRPYRALFDAEFIAHARTDVPALLEAVESVLSLHWDATIPGRTARDDATRVCGECGEKYPCTTVRAVREAVGDA